MKRKQQATASGEDYLEAILVIQMHKGAVRSVDIARHMEVSKPSVCHADYSGRSAHALKRVQRTGIAVQQSSAAVQPRPLGMG